jgi:hypothetical protein
MHIMKHHGGKGSTILDMTSGNFVFSDDEGSVELTASEGKRELTVKDKQGKITFQGPVNSPADHKKLPPEVLARLEGIGTSELSDEDDDLEVETKVVEPATKTRHMLPADPSESGMRSL